MIGAAHSARNREVDGAFPARRPHRSGTVPRGWLPERTPFVRRTHHSGCTSSCRGALGRRHMRRVHRHTASDSRAGAAIVAFAAILDFALLLARFSHFQDRIDLAPWSDQDSVAERASPLLLMLTHGV